MCIDFVLLILYAVCVSVVNFLPITKALEDSGGSRLLVSEQNFPVLPVNCLIQQQMFYLHSNKQRKIKN